jgi:hypothetical protein
MVGIEELFKSEGKVEAPDGFTRRLLLTFYKVNKAKEFVDFIFTFWTHLVIFIFKTIDSIFAIKRKSDV